GGSPRHAPPSSSSRGCPHRRTGRRPTYSPRALRAWEVPPCVRGLPAGTPPSSSSRGHPQSGGTSHAFKAVGEHRTPLLDGQTFPAGAPERQPTGRSRLNLRLGRTCHPSPEPAATRGRLGSAAAHQRPLTCAYSTGRLFRSSNAVTSLRY